MGLDEGPLDRARSKRQEDHDFRATRGVVACLDEAAVLLENSRLFDFQLSSEDMAALDALDSKTRIGPDPDNFNF